MMVLPKRETTFQHKMMVLLKRETTFQQKYWFYYGGRPLFDKTDGFTKAGDHLLTKRMNLLKRETTF